MKPSSLKKATSRAALAAALVFLGTSGARGQHLAYISTNINVLREYDGQRNDLITKSSSASGGAVIQSIGANEGSGHKTQAGSFSAGSTVRETYNLPRPTTVASYNIQNINPHRNASVFTLEGFTSSGWVTLDSFNPTNVNFIQRNFTPTTVTALRYTATGPNLTGGSDQFFQLFELMVFLSPGQSVDLENRGHNILRDLRAAGKITAMHASTSGGGWAAVSGSASTLVDGTYGPDNVKAQAPPNNPGERAAVAYSFDKPYPLNFGVLGTYDAQSVSNWQFWTSNLGSPSPTNDADWVLQFSRGVPGVGVNPGFVFPLSQPGDWRHVRLTWGTQFGAMVELELYSIPEPGTLLLGALGSLLLWARRRSGTA